MSDLLGVIAGMVWAMEPDRLRALARLVENHERGVRFSREDIVTRIAAARDAGETTQPNPGYQVLNGVAVIPVYGVLERRADAFSDVSGMASTQQISADLERAVADPNVRAILLDLDSPGGSTDGIPELADEIRAARAGLPVWAFASGMAASGGYWLAAQASRFIASESAVVGSIGVYSVIYDRSRQLANEGVDVTLVKQGAVKGALATGVPVSDAAVADQQRLVDHFYEAFVEAVAAGRNMPTSSVRALADGRVHVGQPAVKAGLVDGIATFRQTLRDLRVVAGIPEVPMSSRTNNRAASQTAPRAEGESTVTAAVAVAAPAAPEPQGSAPVTAPVSTPPAAPAQSVAPAAPVQATTTPDGASPATPIQTPPNEPAAVPAQAAPVSAPPAQALSPVPAPVGHRPLSGSAAPARARSASNTAATAFEARIQEHREKGLTRAQAVAKIAREEPELREALVEEANAAR